MTEQLRIPSVPEDYFSFGQKTWHLLGPPGPRATVWKKWRNSGPDCMVHRMDLMSPLTVWTVSIVPCLTWRIWMTSWIQASLCPLANLVSFPLEGLAPSSPFGSSSARGNGLSVASRGAVVLVTTEQGLIAQQLVLIPRSRGEIVVDIWIQGLLNLYL